MKKKSLMMLERLLPFIGTMIRRDTRRLARRLISAWRVESVLNAAWNSRAKKKMSPQFYKTRGNALTARIRIQQLLSRLSEGRTFSTRPKSRLPHGATTASSSQKTHPYRKRAFKIVEPLRLQDLHPALASAIQFRQYTSTSRWLFTPGLKYTNDKPRAPGRFRLCI